MIPTDKVWYRVHQERLREIATQVADVKYTNLSLLEETMLLPSEVVAIATELLAARTQRDDEIAALSRLLEAAKEVVEKHRALAREIANTLPAATPIDESEWIMVRVPCAAWVRLVRGFAATTNKEAP